MGLSLCLKVIVYKDPKEPNVYKFPLRNQNSIPLQEYIQIDMLHRCFNAFNPITVIENPLYHGVIKPNDFIFLSKNTPQGPSTINKMEYDIEF